MDLMSILNTLFQGGGATPQDRSMLQTVAPGKTALPQVLPPVPPPVSTAVQPPAPAPVPPVPGNQTIPIPNPRPSGVQNTLTNLSQLFGPSMSPSQQGVVSQSPSQGPGAAVAPAAAAPAPTSIMEAIQRITQPAAQRAPTAPAPPGPRAMAPGAASKLIGGQNPLAQVAQTPPVLVLLSKLLGGR